jgi:arsenate reductase-like glutaredoxin family protein
MSLLASGTTSRFEFAQRAYRRRNMAEKTPSREEAIRLMSKNPNLIKRPVVVRGDRIVLGLDMTAYISLLK